MGLSFSQLLNSLTAKTDGRYATTIPDNWMQGRTTYGGLSAALCLAVIEKTYPGLPPLRAAQVTFTGPAGGAVLINTDVIRQGRSVTHICATLTDESGTATHAVFSFGVKRESRLDADFTSRPSVPSPEQSNDLFSGKFGPAFTRNYECLIAKGAMPLSGAKQSEQFIWVRHKDKNTNNLAALIGIADVPPPAVLPMFTELAPISSMNWMMNFIVDDARTTDGWWLIRSAAEHARKGYSSQDMQVWNREGQLVVTGRQNIAIYY